MAKKPETRLQSRIQKALKDKYGKDIWLAKIYVGPFQQAGIPDLLCCVRGTFVALEVKMPGEWPSRIQEKTMADIGTAGGYAKTVWSVEDALDAVEKAL